MERENKELNTVGGHKLIVNTYITGREMRNIRDCYINDAQVDFSNLKTVPLTGIKGDSISKSEDISIEALVVSVDGSKENIVEAVGNLPSADYDQVVEYINTITNPKKAESDTSKA